MNGNAGQGTTSTRQFGNGTVTESFKRNSDSLTLFMADATYHPRKMQALGLGIRMGVGMNNWSETYSSQYSDPFFGRDGGSGSYSKTGFAMGPRVAYEIKVGPDFSIEPRVSYTFVTVNSITTLESLLNAKYRF